MSALVERISELKAQRNAVILVHNYQRPEVQEIADYLGDSLGLSQRAAELRVDVIVFCGVDFMAESAAILSPEKTVLLPELEAQCPMAAMITPAQVRKLKAEHPEAAVVCYVNTSAEVKAESDVCCTSSNAVRVVNALDAEEIIFVPDKNLASYVALNTDKTIIPFEGYCPTHHQILPGDILLAKEEHPHAEVLVHPECRPEVVALGDHVFSTGGMVKYVKSSKHSEFIIATEEGLIHRLKRENPEKSFHLASSYIICPNMKMITLQSIVDALEKNQHVVSVREDVRRRARKALDRMIEIGRGD
jgi:quinolinate synthase